MFLYNIYAQIKVNVSDFIELFILFIIKEPRYMSITRGNAHHLINYFYAICNAYSQYQGNI